MTVEKEKNVQQWMRDKIYCFTTHGAIHSAMFCLGQMRGSAFYVSKPLFWTKIILQSCKLSPIESSLCDMYPVDWFSLERIQKHAEYFKANKDPKSFLRKTVNDW